MSTSVKNLTPMQMLFQRPAFFFGVVAIILMILAKPSHNVVPVLVAIPLYWLLYQNRRAIYKLGAGRFDFLACLFYVPFLVSAVINWQFQETNTLNQLKNISFSELFTNGGAMRKLQIILNFAASYWYC